MVNYLKNLKDISHYRLRHPEANLVLDTNVLLLFLVGAYDEEYLRDCPLMKDNGKSYSGEHFRLLIKIIKMFINKVVITPQILAEINSLSRTRLFKGQKLDEYFVKVIKELDKFEESYVHLKELLSEEGQIIRFGFTDVSIITTAKKMGYAVLTDERDLYETFYDQTAVINFSTVATYELYNIGT